MESAGQGVRSPGVAVTLILIQHFGAKLPPPTMDQTSGSGLADASLFFTSLSL
jgi:hypothetical protein